MYDVNQEPADDELAQYEKQVLSELKPEAEDPILDQQADDEPPAPTPSARTSTEPPPSAAPTPAPTPAPAESEPSQGDPRAALRASRRAERQARDLADRNARENEQLRAQLAELRGTPDADPNADPDLAALEVDVPQAAAVVKKLMTKVDELTAQLAGQKAPAQAEPDFTPEVLPDALQEIVDDIPQLLTWQTNAQHKDHWAMAKSTDVLLSSHPAWKDKAPAERFKEVVRRVNSELGTPSSTPALTAAQLAAQRIQDAPGRDLETLSDLRGGVVPSSKSGADFFSMKSDDEVMAALARQG